MQQLLIRALVALLLATGIARADSTIPSLPAAATPIPDGSCIYVDQGPGTDTKLCTQYSTALGINSAAANTVQGNFTNSAGNATANAVPSCPDTGGQHLNYVSGAGFTCGTSTPAFARVIAFPADPIAGNSSVTAVMMGLAVAVTPGASGKVHIIVTGVAQNSVASITDNIQLRQGTGAAPINGATLTGTQLGVLTSTNINTTTGRLSWTLDGYVTGLTVNTAIWIDVGLASSTGGDTATISLVTVYAEEVP